MTDAQTPVEAEIKENLRLLGERACEVEKQLDAVLMDGEHWEEGSADNGTTTSARHLFRQRICNVRGLQDLSPQRDSGRSRITQSLKRTPVDQEVADAIRDLFAITRSGLFMGQQGDSPLEEIIKSLGKRGVFVRDTGFPEYTGSLPTRALFPRQMGPEEIAPKQNIPLIYDHNGRPHLSLAHHTYCFDGKAGIRANTRIGSGIPPEVPLLCFVTPSHWKTASRDNDWMEDCRFGITLEDISMASHTPPGSRDLQSHQDKGGHYQTYKYPTKATIDCFALV
ncbi:MAG: hypothetical protein WC777_05810 [Candidatus Gracilibacteria bacterium]|jgi:hypothetical protein